MSSRTCDLALAALALAACGSSDRRTIDVCGRGDRPELADALAGGSLAVDILDSDGDLVSSGVAPAGDARRLDLEFDGGERVRVSGRDAAGVEVAIGDAPLDSAGACVCLALSRQAAAACGGLGCVVEPDGCRFIDDETGERAGVRAFTLPVEEDTALVAAAPRDPYGGEPILPVERAAATGLLRFDMTRLPGRSIVDGAELALTWNPPVPGRPPRPLSIHLVEEPWEASATWLERASGQPWSSPGCGEGSCAAEPIARMATDGGVTSRRVSLGLAVSGWVDPAQNHGLAIRSEGNPTLVRSAEAAEGGAAGLVVSFHLPEDELADPEPGPLCGNGLIEADEECDDGDGDDDDACTGCRIARCGDGVVRAGVEECDHGGRPDESCTSVCLACTDPEAVATWVGEFGHCYALYLPPFVRQYGGAETTCDSRGHGHLAALATAEEHDAVIAGLGVPSTTPVWIGLSDRDIEGTFVWASGRPLGAFDRWEGTEPNGGDCVILTGSTWVDAPCDLDRGFICERTPWIRGEGGSAYRVVRPLETWENAELICEASGAHLAALTTAEENAGLNDAVNTDGYIGLGELVDGALSWVTGEAVDFTAFASPPDLDGDRYCARLDPAAWILAGCTRNRRFVCESD